ncbi:hypothetical protein ACQ7DA_03600 [Zafaria sp. J156]|uniref:hypothetical protein n=1 Tax=Zafaria sp. J156 TaxID=3116490 RepID=UPI002E7A15A4|nr:hypothetical protein [Zafaria sp. J156]MEE1620307.1 hypothetical protein [Zafaria sp. J156]
MRWDSLFADLEAQLNGEAARDRVVEIQEMVRVERSQLPIAGRLAGHEGGLVTVVALGGLRLQGTLRHVGEGWLAIESGAGEYLLPTPALRSLEGVGARVAPEGPRRSKVSLRMALRAVVRDRAVVVLHSRDGDVLGTGTLDHVGTDYLQLAVHDASEYRRSPEVRSTLLVPLGALAALRRIA